MATGRIVAGLILVALGVLFLLDQLDYLEAGDLLGQWWPAALIALGAVQLAVAPRAFLGPLIVVAIGAILLLSTTGILAISVWVLLWPLVLIGIGIWIILGRLLLAPTASDTDAIDAFAMFSEHKTTSTSTSFKGGSLTALFGSVEADLRQAQVAGPGAGLSVTAAFGGVNIVVPRTWRVAVQGIPVFGGLENKTSPDGPLPADAPTLRVQGMALFGGIEVKN